ncbi:hypothetical protein [Phaeovulum vinaykumarii]
MFERPGCRWCARWNDEIAPIYPLTDAGRRAALLRHDISAALAPEWELERKVVFTPTFVVLEDGREMGRIEGYAGQDFFWGFLDQILETAGKDDDG